MGISSQSHCFSDDGVQNAFVAKLSTVAQPPFTAKDCILVNKVYDQCFAEELVTGQVPVSSACPGVIIPPGSVVGCIPLSGSATCTFAGTVVVTPPLTPFFEEVLVLNSFEVSAPIISPTGVTLCAPTLTLFGAARADLWVPPGTTVACDILAFGDCTCTLLASPTGLPVILACTGKICKEIQVTAPVKLLVPTYGFCDVPACTFQAQPGFTCPPEPLFPPQRPVPPAITKAFGAATIPSGEPTSLTFTITNPNPGVALTGVAFTDPLPAGMGVFGVPITSACGGTVTTPGAVNISLAGGTVAAGASCSFSVNVASGSIGLNTNTTNPVTSTNGGTGNTASASIMVTGG